MKLLRTISGEISVLKQSRRIERSNGSFLQDPMNLQSKLQKQEAFVSELEANESRIDGIKEKGKELIDMNHYAKDSIQLQLDEIESLWDEVKIKTTEKGKVTVTSLCKIDYNSVFYKLFDLRPCS